jgi:hypothetical protein
MEADIVTLHGMETWTTRGVQLHPYLPQQYLDGGEWSASLSGQFTNGEKLHVPRKYKAARAPETVGSFGGKGKLLVSDKSRTTTLKSSSSYLVTVLTTLSPKYQQYEEEQWQQQTTKQLLLEK